MSDLVSFVTDGPVAVVTIEREAARNAVDGPTAAALSAAFRRFEADEGLAVAVLAGRGGSFCAGADLKGFAEGRANSITRDGDGPMGPTRMKLSKPAIAAIEGYAVAGGLELAIWCDLRVAARDAILGVFCRRFGVPLIDGGTVRLPRLVGEGRALDLILTGRPVGAEEALRMGLVDRVVEPGRALEAAVALGREIAAVPQTCLREDRLSAREQWTLPLEEALRNELDHGLRTLASGETAAGLGRFVAGEGRHGETVPRPRRRRAETEGDA
jgi:enoyl-CoA hydratase